MKEMENFIFERFITETFLRIFGQFLRNFGEIGSLLEEEQPPRSDLTSD